MFATRRRRTHASPPPAVARAAVSMRLNDAFATGTRRKQNRIGPIPFDETDFGFANPVFRPPCPAIFQPALHRHGRGHHPVTGCADLLGEPRTCGPATARKPPASCAGARDPNATRAAAC